MNSGVWRQALGGCSWGYCWVSLVGVLSSISWDIRTPTTTVIYIYAMMSGTALLSWVLDV
jgi:CHASE2 domain-containing sensor protein